MIARLTGRVAETAADSAVLDVSGVGYLVHASRAVLERLQGADGPVTLLIETQVREDAITLYGFFDRAEREWFRLLMGVQGVGGRVALAILSVLPPEALTTAILAEDRRSLTRADGVGPKLAGRLVGELRDKAGAVALSPAGPAAAVPGTGTVGPAAAGAGAGTPSATADALSALVNLGYGRSEAWTAITGAAKDLGDGATVEALLTRALSKLAPEG